MTNVILVSEILTDISLIKKELSPLKAELDGFQVEVADLHNVENYFDFGLNIVVFSLQELNQFTLQSIQKIKKVDYYEAVIVLAEVPYGSRRLVHEANDFIVVEKPYEVQNLLGIIRRICHADTVTSRKFRRYNVLENVVINKTEDRGLAKATVHNISRGGAFVRGRLKDFKVGEKVKIHIHRESIDSARVVYAKVVWLKQQDHINSTGAGLKFLSADEALDFLKDMQVA